MKLYLRGHGYKYAVEQMLLALFPEERPEYPEGAPEGDCRAVCSLSHGEQYTTANTVIVLGGLRSHGAARVANSALADKLTTDRECQKIIKLSFYRAAVRLTGDTPAWGALTGIRPAKIVTKLMEQGRTEAECDAVLKNTYYVSPERRRLCIDSARASFELKQGLSPNDISLYVGIPFCPTRCAYCSFVSQSVEKSMKLIPLFFDTLLEEIDAAAAAIAPLGLRIISVYFGGGTPTTLSADQLAQLIDRLYSRFDLGNVREFTVEAGRPDTITPEKLRVMRTRGVTRISVNPQTMSDEVLEIIGRRHTADDIIRALGEAREAGFDDINMDLIAGLPGDTPDGFRRSLDIVASLAPENITVHTLSLKKGSRITLEGSRIPSAAEVAEMLGYAYPTLRSMNMSPYYMYRQKFMTGSFENTGWCLPGHIGVYNICMMEELHTIVSLGGGGVTKLVFPDSGRIERIINFKYPLEYIKGIDRLRQDKSDMARQLSERR